MRGAFTSSIGEVGSPGTVPEPRNALLLAATLAALALRRPRRARD